MPLTSLLLLGLTLITALAIDIAIRRIPNLLVVFALVGGVASAAIPSSEPVSALVRSLSGVAIGLIVMLPFFLLRAMGGGDAKLIAAIGAFFGPTQIIGVVLLTFIAGGFLAIGAALCLRALPRVIANLHLVACALRSGADLRSERLIFAPTGRLPYAIAITAGTALQLWLASVASWPFR